MNEKACLYIPVDEYRELLRTQRDAECLKAIMEDRVKSYMGIPQDELEILCKMFLQMPEEQPAEQDESW